MEDWSCLHRVPPAHGPICQGHRNNDDEQVWHTVSTKKTDTFPVKLHYIRSEMEKDGLRHVASWQTHGRCFFVHDKKLFTQTILPLWFRQSKFDSFQRQLNTYGFGRITSGPDKGGYYHELFQRGNFFLAQGIQSKKKGRKNGQPQQPARDNHPDTYKLPPLPVTNAKQHTKDFVSSPSSPPDCPSIEDSLPLPLCTPASPPNSKMPSSVVMGAQEIWDTKTVLSLQPSRQFERSITASSLEENSCTTHSSAINSIKPHMVAQMTTVLATSNLSLVDIILQELKSYHEHISRTTNTSASSNV